MTLSLRISQSSNRREPSEHCITEEMSVYMRSQTVEAHKRPRAIILANLLRKMTLTIIKWRERNIEP